MHLVYDIMTVTVSVRINEEEFEQIKEMGINPSTFIRDLIRNELRKQKVRKTLQWLRENRIDAPGPTGAEIVRELRDTRWA
jgi:post-segregation antitoxin (ccd killing protein)